jgi:hypothetical protein
MPMANTGMMDCAGWRQFSSLLQVVKPLAGCPCHVLLKGPQPLLTASAPVRYQQSPSLGQRVTCALAKPALDLSQHYNGAVDAGYVAPAIRTLENAVGHCLFLKDVHATWLEVQAGAMDKASARRALRGQSRYLNQKTSTCHSIFNSYSVSWLFKPLASSTT